MILNYFKVIYRNLFRNKTYALVNILGLSVGLSFCLVILEYVKFEKSYDKFHPDSSNIFRVILGYESAGETVWDAAVFAPTGPALKNDFSEVIDFVRISPEYFGLVLNHDERIFEEKKVYYADSTFFTFFGYKLLHGDPQTALKEPNTVVLSLSVAEKYFGEKASWTENPIGKLILINNKESYILTGIMEDTPANSHLKFEVLISFTTFINKNDPSNNWGWNDFYTYIKVNPGIDKKEFQSKVLDFPRKYQEKETKDKLVLQPVEDIHLHSNIGFELEPNGSAQSVYFLSIIALIILVVAWINYVNLATARSEGRAKEVGIRKVNGASWQQVMSQLLLESFLMNFIAVLIALVIVQALTPFIGVLLGKPMTFSLFSDSSFIKALVLLYTLGSFISGIYPAFVLSNFNPVDVFKSGAHNIARGKSFLRQSLVVFQFVISIGLIAGTIIISNQLDFIKSQDLGFEHEKTLVINSPRTLESEIEFLNRYRQFKQEALKYPEVTTVTISSSLPGRLRNDLDMNSPIKMLGQDNSYNKSFAVFRVDQDFMETLQMKMAAGSFFTGENLMTDDQLIGDEPDDVIVVNRKASELLGYSDPMDIIGRKLDYGGDIKEVIGVVENYHHKSLKNNFEPILIRNRIANTLYISIRLSDNQSLNVNQVIHKLNNIWQTTYPGSPFLYSFLRDDVNNHYLEEERFKKIFSIFSTLSIFIGCLGLFGLVSYSVTVRMKEIGIRKVLGATFGSILILFSKEFLRLIIIAVILGIPLAVYVLDLWLGNFAYRAPVTILIFILPILLVVFFGFVSVFAQLMKAALKNPVESLRSE